MPPSADPPPARTAGDADGAGAPAEDLAEVWTALDALPTAASRVDLAATTVDLVAARLADDASPTPRSAAGPAAWGIRAAIVVAALAAGLAAGRSLAPDPDRRVLEQLPLIEHLGLLREAGSVAFLEGLADRMAGRQGPPRWLRFARDPEELRSGALQFDASLAALAAEPIGRDAGEDVIQRRRQRVESLPAAERGELERSAEAFEKLAGYDRRELTAVARVLRDPGQPRLREAARTWHVLLAAMNPMFRRTLVEMPVAERLEFVDQRPERFEPRPPGRPRDDPRDRRPGEGGVRPPEGERQPDAGGVFDGPGPRPPRNGGPPRPDGDPGRFNGPALFRPAAPPPAAGPAEAPGETRAPPR
jgi:hypothetical protein